MLITIRDLQQARDFHLRIEESDEIVSQTLKKKCVEKWPELSYATLLFLHFGEILYETITHKDFILKSRELNYSNGNSLMISLIVSHPGLSMLVNALESSGGCLKLDDQSLTAYENWMDLCGSVDDEHHRMLSEVACSFPLTASTKPLSVLDGSATSKVSQPASESSQGHAIDPAAAVEPPAAPPAQPFRLNVRINLPLIARLLLSYYLIGQDNPRLVLPILVIYFLTDLGFFRWLYLRIYCLVTGQPFDPTLLEAFNRPAYNQNQPNFFAGWGREELADRFLRLPGREGIFWDVYSFFLALICSFYPYWVPRMHERPTPSVPHVEEEATDSVGVAQSESSCSTSSKTGTSEAKGEPVKATEELQGIGQEPQGECGDLLVAAVSEDLREESLGLGSLSSPSSSSSSSSSSSFASDSGLVDAAETGVEASSS